MSRPANSRPGLSPPPRTAETEHLYDRGVPAPHNKAEARRRKYTVWSHPNPPSKATPPEFWGERLPFFTNHELHRVDNMLNHRPKKKRKPKNKPQEVTTMMMDEPRITQGAEQEGVAQSERPRKRKAQDVQQVEARLSSPPSGPLPGFLHGRGKKRKLETSIYDMPLPYDAPAKRRGTVLEGRSLDPEEGPSLPPVNAELGEPDSSDDPVPVEVDALQAQTVGDEAGVDADEEGARQEPAEVGVGEEDISSKIVATARSDVGVLPERDVGGSPGQHSDREMAVRSRTDADL